MHDMLEIGDPDRAEEWLLGKLAAKEKVMGFGHRVYKNGDSRVPTMKAALLDIAAATGGEKWVRMYDVLEKTMAGATGNAPNLDFPTGRAGRVEQCDSSAQRVLGRPPALRRRLTACAPLWLLPLPERRTGASAS
ncbi:hypothetical protein JOJ86_006162 [Rhodococcus percolatus]|nr:hypothetical protein [Rhodococcus opacus]MBP2208436.1 hypothetical protein [Rhodococcus opacus]